MSDSLTAEHLRAILDYDPDTGLWVRRWQEGVPRRTNVRFAGKPTGYLMTIGYIGIGIGKKQYRAHRLAVLWMTGSWPKHEVDHINGVRSDTRWANLREATKSQNMQNRGASVANVAGVKGVGWIARLGKWRAQIMVGEKNKYLGLFDTKEDASAAYQAAAAIHHGAFAHQGLSHGAS